MASLLASKLIEDVDISLSLLTIVSPMSSELLEDTARAAGPLAGKLSKGLVPEPNDEVDTSILVGYPPAIRPITASSATTLNDTLLSQNPCQRSFNRRHSLAGSRASRAMASFNLENVETWKSVSLTDLCPPALHDKRAHAPFVQQAFRSCSCVCKGAVSFTASIHLKPSPVAPTAGV